jgi:hypothetical protein
MKSTAFALAVAAASFVSTSAFADGFVCTSGDLKVKVYNQTNPNAGTRNAAVMILSDESVQQGNKTIAKFTAPQTLSNDAASYTAKVDLRYGNSNRAGEYIAGTRLGQIDTITLDVEFSYNTPVDSGDYAMGLLTVVKRNGDVTELDMDCERYLRN